MSESESQKELAYLPYLDGWRGIAIIMVLIGHFGHSSLGSFGVSVFFVLSGFLMSRILFIKKTPLNVFYRRRFSRILPAFWLYILVIFLGYWLFFQEFYFDEFLSTAFFLGTYFPDVPIFRNHAPIGHIWSLNVEEHCYMFLSVVCLLAIRFGELIARVLLTVCCVLCVALFIFYKYNPPDAQSAFMYRTEVGAFPLLLSCSLFLWLNKYPIKIHQVVSPVSFVIAMSVYALSTSTFLSYLIPSILLAISVNTLTAAPTAIIKILSNSVLRWFGICSYSIYLWQQAFWFSGRYAKNLPYEEYYYAIGAVMSILVGAVSFYFFENPMRKWLSGRAV